MRHVARREGGGKLPHLTNSMEKIKRGEDEIEKKEKNEENQIKERRREKCSRKREKGEERKRKIFLVFQRSKLDGPRIKVGTCNESYTWVPKSGSFVKLQVLGNFPTQVISSLKVI